MRTVLNGVLTLLIDLYLFSSVVCKLSIYQDFQSLMNMLNPLAAECMLTSTYCAEKEKAALYQVASTQLLALPSFASWVKTGKQYESFLLGK